MERLIGFSRNRHMLCGQCGRQWVVNLDWIDRWEQGREDCPGCGVTCEVEAAPRVTVDPHDPALNDENVAQLHWYHTSTQPDWPTQDFNPAAGLTDDTRRRMGGDHHVATWAERQRARALHVGTFEAAIHNMLRRIDDQAGAGSQFYLYRVRLAPNVNVREGWLIDPSDWLGDVVLDEVCPPGIDVARYLNYHEDPGALSLALGRAAIASTQQIAIPTLESGDPDWTATAVGELARVTLTAPPSASSPSIGRRNAPSPRSARARELTAPLAERLPVNLRSEFEAVAAFNDDREPAEWALYVTGVVNMLLAPEQVLTKLDGETFRYL